MVEHRYLHHSPATAFQPTKIGIARHHENAAASPILMPLRLEEKAAMLSGLASKGAKPLIVSGESVSAPPQITVSESAQKQSGCADEDACAGSAGWKRYSTNRLKTVNLGDKFGGEAMVIVAAV